MKRKHKFEIVSLFMGERLLVMMTLTLLIVAWNRGARIGAEFSLLICLLPGLVGLCAACVLRGSYFVAKPSLTVESLVIRLPITARLCNGMIGLALLVGLVARHPDWLGVIAPLGIGLVLVATSLEFRRSGVERVRVDAEEMRLELHAGDRQQSLDLASSTISWKGLGTVVVCNKNESTRLRFAELTAPFAVARALTLAKLGSEAPARV